MAVRSSDILVLGAGLLGCSLARELAQAGQRVTVLDRGRGGGAASYAAAGLLSPTLATSPTGPLIELCYRSARQYEAWVCALREEGAGDVGYRRCGMLEVYEHAAEATAVRENLASHERPGRRAAWLTPDELQEFEPALISGLAGAASYPDDAQVNANRLTRQMASVAQRASVAIFDGVRVRRLVAAGQRIASVETDAGTFTAQVIVVACGAWSSELFQEVGVQLPVFPVKGQLLLAECRVAPVRTPLHCEEALFAPQPDGRLMLGVTVEEGRRDDRVTLAGIRQILDRAIGLVPGIQDLTPVRAWAGLRPATPDGWPYMGRAEPYENLWVHTGHYRKGILLAPVCSRLMAESILQGRLHADLAPFSPARISGLGTTSAAPAPRGAS